jgi:ribosomal-protein-alanine N-acetyltransferase
MHDFSDKALSLRAAHIADAGTIASMSRLLVEHGLRWRWTRTRVRHSIRDKETMVLVANVEGALSGFAIMKFRDDESHLHLLAVEARRQRSGIGSAMLDWLEKSCRTAGIRNIRVELRAANQAARIFYEHMGFRFAGQLAGYYDKREAATVMVKTLVEATPP